MRKLLTEQKAQVSVEMLVLLGAVVFVAMVVGFTVKSIVKDVQ
ncbi:MAG: class III signal peptide-containing protein [Candidatus Diapherotrites archaeon]|nr:class III signal peptide-containing protein [Candidatus Diapherotrites archaeon]